LLALTSATPSSSAIWSNSAAAGAESFFFEHAI
jgi:hypothetical protein